MKILLDECVDWRLSRDLQGHEVKTARQMGWATVKNGELLVLASETFDVFVTVDRKLPSQQNLEVTPVSWTPPRLGDYGRTRCRRPIPRIRWSIGSG